MVDGEEWVKTQIQLNEQQIKKVQDIELEMLIEIERICQKNNIKYSVIGGTLLGAVRHGGFIPWDDDADVVMLRKEYNKFVDACEKDLDTTRFYFQDLHKTPGYRWGYGKLRRKDTLFMRHGQEHMPYEQGIFVDIFSCDNVPDGEFARKIHECKCFLLRKLMWAEVGQYTEKNKSIQCLYKIMAKIPAKWTIKQIDKLAERWNKKDTELIRTLLFPTPKGTAGFPRKWYEEVEPILFEGVQLHGLKKREEYLVYKFGKQYMQLPPEEKRKIHPVSQIRFGDEVEED